MNPHPLLHQRNSKGTPWYDILSYITGGYTVTDRHTINGPHVVYRPIPESVTQPTIEPRSAILHTNAGLNSASSLWAYISRASVTGEPHFQVGYESMEQYMPLNRRADCNYSANLWREGLHTYGAISFETQDNGSATVNSTPWTFRQLDLITNTLTCIGVVYGVACVQPATWDASGIGHHTLFPFQGIGRPAWTNVRGKTCPGAARIAQMDEIRRQVATKLGEFAKHTDWKCGGR